MQKTEKNGTQACYERKSSNQKRRNRKKNREELQSNWKTNNKMAVSTYLSIITLNASGLNTLIKRHRVDRPFYTL